MYDDLQSKSSTKRFGVTSRFLPTILCEHNTVIPNEYIKYFQVNPSANKQTRDMYTPARLATVKLSPCGGSRLHHHA
jgi:hypothetical protein